MNRCEFANLKFYLKFFCNFLYLHFYVGRVLTVPDSFESNKSKDYMWSKVTCFDGTNFISI